jgi:hypothetical protein
MNLNSSSTESASTPAATIPLYVLKHTTTKRSTTELTISKNNGNKHEHKILVPAGIAAAHETMAYSAKVKAQASTKAFWPVANARATY